MNIHMLIQDQLEGQGIKWLLTSQWNDVQVKLIATPGSLDFDHADFYIIDMKFISEGKVAVPRHVEWLGLSSERTFRTIYQALSMKAEDVLFRPLQPERLIAHVQQLRFRLRNRATPLKQRDVGASSLAYEDFLVGNTYPETAIFYSLIVPSQETGISRLVAELEACDFPPHMAIFPFSNFVLAVHPAEDKDSLSEAYRAFFNEWKRQSDVLLAIYLYKGSKGDSYRQHYKTMRRFYERVFYDGYDILSWEEEDIGWQEIDPFLSPLEQRKWIEMLEKRQAAEIRGWMEQDFLTLAAPYPNPEMVRVRLTSILAQVRRYMSANSLASGGTEEAYHALFETIVREPVVYRIVETFISYITELFGSVRASSDMAARFGEKVRERIAANYWDSTFSLAACAEDMKIHKSTLSRKYTQETGESFTDSLLKKRVEEAARLLKETDLSISDVAAAAGFTHATYFSKRFKKVVGVTPYGYRHL